MHGSRLFLMLTFCALIANPARGEQSIQWQNNLENAKRLAAQSNRLVLVHFWAPWCKPCMRLEREVFNQPDVQQAIEAAFVPVRLNTDEFPATAGQFGVKQIPTDVIVRPSGEVIARLNCPLVASEYLGQLAQTTQPSTAVAAGTGLPSLAPGADVARVQYLNNPHVATNVPQSDGPPLYGEPATNAAIASSVPAVPAYSNDRYAEFFNRQARTSPAPVNMQQPGSGIPQGSVAMNAPFAGPPLQGSVSVPQITTPWQPQQVEQPPADTRPLHAQGLAAQTPTMGAPPQQALASAPPGVATDIGPIGYGGPQGQGPAVAGESGPNLDASPANLIRNPTMVPVAEAPPVGLDGYCPVHLAEKKAWAKGNPSFGVVHRGRTYLFASSENQQTFLSNPDRFSPALCGIDPVLKFDQGQEMAGKREYGRFYGNRVFLMSSPQSQSQFDRTPQKYAAEVLQAEAPQPSRVR